ncbi:MAG: NB-ARC domain-containing protein [Planctomycetota bacterium]
MAKVFNHRLLREQRRRLPQKAVARDLGWSDSKYGRWESGRVNKNGFDLGRHERGIEDLARCFPSVPREAWLIDQPEEADPQAIPQAIEGVKAETRATLVELETMDLEQASFPAAPIPDPVSALVPPETALEWLAGRYQTGRLLFGLGMDYLGSSSELRGRFAQRLLQRWPHGMRPVALDAEELRANAFQLANVFCDELVQIHQCDAAAARGAVQELLESEVLLHQAPSQPLGPELTALARLDPTTLYDLTWDNDIGSGLAHAGRRVRLIDEARLATGRGGGLGAAWEVVKLLGTLASHVVVTADELARLPELRPHVHGHLSLRLRVDGAALLLLGVPPEDLRDLPRLLEPEAADSAAAFAVFPRIRSREARALWRERGIRCVSLCVAPESWAPAVGVFLDDLRPPTAAAEAVSRDDPDDGRPPVDEGPGVEATSAEPPAAEPDAAPEAPLRVEELFVGWRGELGRPRLPPRHPLMGSVFVERSSVTTAEVKSMLQGGHNVGLLGLLGIGGVGKTYLAMRVADELVREGWHVVWLNLLQFQQSTESVLEQLVGAYGLRLRPGLTLPRQLQAVELLAEEVFTQRPRTLVVLDNAEGFVDLKALLNVLGHLPILVTSRMASFPDEISYLPLGSLSQSESRQLCEQLLGDHARFVPELSEDDWAHLDRICARLGGHPLAIRMVLAGFLRGTDDVGRRDYFARTLERLSRDPLAALPAAEENSARAGETLHQTVYRTFDWLFSDLERIEPSSGRAARLLLPLVAVVGANGARRDTVQRVIAGLERLLAEARGPVVVDGHASNAIYQPPIPEPPSTKPTSEEPAPGAPRPVSVRITRGAPPPPPAESEGSVRVTVRRPIPTLAAGASLGELSAFERPAPPDGALGIGVPGPDLGLELPPHPEIDQGDRYFLKLLRGSISLEASEKLAILKGLPKMSDQQLHDLIGIFEEERRKFGRLDERHQVRLLALRRKAEAQWVELVAQRRARLHAAALPGPPSTHLLSTLHHYLPEEEAAEQTEAGVAGDPTAGGPAAAVAGSARVEAAAAEEGPEPDDPVAAWREDLSALRVPSTFRQAVAVLQGVALLERGEGEVIGIHPLIREFAFEERRQAEEVSELEAVDGPTLAGVQRAGLEALTNAPHEGESLLDLLPRLGTQAELAIRLVVEHHHHHYFREAGWGLCRQLLEGAAELAARAGLVEQNARLKLYLGELLDRMGRPKRGRELLGEALEVLDRSDRFQERACWGRSYMLQLDLLNAAGTSEAQLRALYETLRDMSCHLLLDGRSSESPAVETLVVQRLIRERSPLEPHYAALGLCAANSAFLSNVVHDLRWAVDTLADRQRMTRPLLSSCQRVFQTAVERSSREDRDLELSPMDVLTCELALARARDLLDPAPLPELELTLADIERRWRDLGAAASMFHDDRSGILWARAAAARDWQGARDHAERALAAALSVESELPAAAPPARRRRLVLLRLRALLARAAVDPLADELSAEGSELSELVRGHSLDELLGWQLLLEGLLAADPARSGPLLSRARAAFASWTAGWPPGLEPYFLLAAERAGIDPARLQLAEPPASLCAWAVDWRRDLPGAAHLEDGRPMRLVRGGLQAAPRGRELWLYPFYVDAAAASLLDLGLAEGAGAERPALVSREIAVEFARARGKRLPTWHEWHTATWQLAAGHAPESWETWEAATAGLLRRIEGAANGQLVQAHPPLAGAEGGPRHEENLRQLFRALMATEWVGAELLRSLGTAVGVDREDFLRAVLGAPTILAHEKVDLLLAARERAPAELDSIVAALAQERSRFAEIELTTADVDELTRGLAESCSDLLASLDVPLPCARAADGPVMGSWAAPTTGSRNEAPPRVLHGDPVGDADWRGELAWVPSFWLAGVRCVFPIFTRQDAERLVPLPA